MTGAQLVGFAFTSHSVFYLSLSLCLSDIMCFGCYCIAFVVSVLLVFGIVSVLCVCYVLNMQIVFDYFWNIPKLNQ